MNILKIRRESGKIFCPLTDSWHIETPEEKVRQEYIKILVKKTVDEYEKHGIICVSAKKYPISCIEAQFTTGGRLGVIQCLV